MVDESWLQQEFLIKGTKAVWRRKTAKQYLKQANTFLELLLLFIYILGASLHEELSFLAYSYVILSIGYGGISL